MVHPDLQHFISELEEEKDLVRVSAEVDPYLEAAAIINRVCKGASNKRALLFENIKGSDIPLTANLFGTSRRVAKALAVAEVEHLASKIRSDLIEYRNIRADEALEHVVGAGRSTDMRTNNAAESISKPLKSLDSLPSLHSWPGDGGKYLTLGQVFTIGPEGGGQNCGLYRIQLKSSDRALLRCHPGAGGAEHLAAWHRQGKAMPIAVVLGGPPALLIGAAASLPSSVDEKAFVEYLTNTQYPSVQCQTSCLTIPAHAEFVIEGEIRPGEEGLEGPFGNHTGSYVSATLAPVIRVNKITMRPDAIYPCTVVGVPPMENVYLAAAIERLVLPLLQHDLPWVCDLHMPLEGIFHRAALVAVALGSGTIQEVGQSLRETQMLKQSRLLILLDHDDSLTNPSEVYWRVVNSVASKQRVYHDDVGLVIDVRGVPGDNMVGPGRETQEKVLSRWPQYGLV